MGNKLYVGNLPYSVRDGDLEQAFGAFGAVTSAKVMMERDTGRSKGFGFVEMGSDAEAQAAIEGMNGQSLGGRNVVVNEARPMEARPPPAAVAAALAARAVVVATAVAAVATAVVAVKAVATTAKAVAAASAAPTVRVPAAVVAAKAVAAATAVATATELRQHDNTKALRGLCCFQRSVCRCLRWRPRSRWSNQASGKTRSSLATMAMGHGMTR